MRIGIDLDGVLYPGGKFRGGCVFDEPPCEGAFEWLESLLESGHQLVLFTSRSCQEPDHPIYGVEDPLEVQKAFWEWVFMHGSADFLEAITLDEGCLIVAPPSWGKVGCDIYVDDRAYYYDGGAYPTPEQLEEHLPHWKLDESARSTKVLQKKRLNWHAVTARIVYRLPFLVWLTFLCTSLALGLTVSATIFAGLGIMYSLGWLVRNEDLVWRNFNKFANWVRKGRDKDIWTPRN